MSLQDDIFDIKNELNGTIFEEQFERIYEALGLKECPNLAWYIDVKFNGNKAAFARAQGVKPQQVSQWLAKGFIVVNDEMYSHRRTLKRK